MTIKRFTRTDASSRPETAVPGPLQLSRRLLKKLAQPRARAGYEALDIQRYIEELKVLGLCGEYFTPGVYADCIEGPLGLEIQMKTIAEVEHPAIIKKLSEEGITGGLIILPGPRPVAYVLTPEMPSPTEEIMSQYHELSHLAGIHPIPPRRLLEPENGGSVQTGCSWRPPGRLLPGTIPPVDDGLCEAEAEKRAEYCYLAGTHGMQFCARYDYALGKDPSGVLDLGRDWVIRS